MKSDPVNHVASIQELFTDGWRPDSSLALPLHIQISGYIQDKIRSGAWPAGMRLAAQRDLARQLGVNRSTLVSALGQLTALGLIEGRRGGGTRVSMSGDTQSNRAGNWNDYVEEGIHYPNLPTIQAINRLEFTDGLIRLGTGELSPELLPNETMKSILADLSRQSLPLSYEEPLGSLQLRTAISKELSNIGIQAAPSSILILSGALQGLQLIAQSLLPRGSTLLLEKPSYLYSIHSFQSAGVKLYGLPMDSEGVMTQGIEAEVHRTKASLLYTIPTYHNPTGILMTEERRHSLMNTTRALGLPVLEDGAYQDLWLDIPPPPPLKALDREGRVLHLGTLSKTVSPGLRIGWAVGPEPVIRRLADIKMQSDYGSSSLSQLLAAKWLEEGHHARHCEVLRMELRQRRDAVLEMLRTHFGHLASWNRPAGGFYIWLSLNKPLPLTKLFRAALEAGLLLNTGDLYNRNDSSHLRLSYAYASLTELEIGIIRLAELVSTF
ncbi:aminotransferase-like domain-containing protein [Paenibacillus wynnii]|uniref:aminotransferase-like domain-containing protein n=1 Tax=Paenibacillus wynnii TaxID=268407 RepID=UPI0027907D69|nr:PLP-dependent aminotransferase family protein [Paenibacillus wynnii]MDQ0192252.1 GntR family transcriptional regulator of abcA and norABC [Paenibacillus wynnii]